MCDAAIEISHMTFGYDKDDKVFENLDLIIEKGKTTGLIGANGAGKSTLLKLLVGLEKSDTGHIQIDGLTMSKKSLREIRSKIGYTFQDADAQLFMTTVFEDVAFGIKDQSNDPEYIDQKVTHALTAVNAVHLKNKPPYKLSGGEKRAVALATVLVMDPSIIILDEPTTGLDPRGRRNLIEILKKTHQTKIIATHDMEMALEICDELIVMKDGQILLKDNPNSVFSNKDLLEASHLEQPMSVTRCPICQTSLGGK